MLASTIARGLRRRGYAVDVASDGEEGLGKALVNDYDVVLLDRDLPGIHGDEVCRQIRLARREARILMLTAAASLDDLVGGLALGADDYLTKPFRFAELVARVQALGRRGGPSAPTTPRRRRRARPGTARGAPGRCTGATDRPRVRGARGPVARRWSGGVGRGTVGEGVG